MTGMGSGDLFVSSWGWFTDNDGSEWRRWRVSIKNQVRCFIELPTDYTVDQAFMVAHAMIDDVGNATDYIRLEWGLDVK